MGLFSTIARAFKDMEARAEAQTAARELAEERREERYWQVMGEIPWDSKVHFCLNCRKAAGDLPLDYKGTDADFPVDYEGILPGHGPRSMLSLAHLSREDARKSFKKIAQAEERLRGSKFTRLCDIHQEIQLKGVISFSRGDIDTYCIDCGKEQGEVEAEENEYSLPLKPRGLQLIGDRALELCDRHIREWRKKWMPRTWPR